MTRIAIIDRADMNAEQARVYDAASELLANKGLSDESYAAAEKIMGLESLVALVASIDDLPDGRHVCRRSAACQPNPARGVARPLCRLAASARPPPPSRRPAFAALGCNRF